MAPLRLFVFCHVGGLKGLADRVHEGGSAKGARFLRSRPPREIENGNRARMSSPSLLAEKGGLPPVSKVEACVHQYDESFESEDFRAAACAAPPVLEGALCGLVGPELITRAAARRKGLG